MRLEQLRYFIAVAEELNFRRAAARLHISQPPLSFHIKALEEELGVRLIERTTRHVALTEAGAAFLVKARSVLTLLRESTDEIKDIGGGRAGKLRVGFTISTSFHPFFYKAIYSYERAYPAVRMTFVEMISGKQLEALSSDRIDVGFLRWPFAKPAGLTMTALIKESLVLAMHRSHPLGTLRRVPLARMKDEPFVTYPASAGSGIGIYKQIQRLCENAGFTPRVVQEALEPSLIVGLVAAGLGVAIVPASHARIRIPGVVFKPIADSGATSELNLVQRTNETNPRVDTFREFVLRFCSA